MKALVTAGNKRLGKAIAVFLVKKGYEVVSSYHSSFSPKLYEGIKGDFSSSTGVRRFCDTYLKKHKKIDLLVNNFGPIIEKSLLEIKGDELIDQYQKICFTPFILMQKLFPYLKKEGGSIVNIGITGLNHEKVFSSFPVYMWAKKDLLSMTRAFAKEGVQANMISPGYLEDTKVFCDKEKLPQKRLISYEEVISCLDFLIDPKNSSVTGQNIEVSGAVGL